MALKDVAAQAVTARGDDLVAEKTYTLRRRRSTPPTAPR